VRSQTLPMQALSPTPKRAHGQCQTNSNSCDSPGGAPLCAHVVRHACMHACCDAGMQSLSHVGYIHALNTSSKSSAGVMLAPRVRPELESGTTQSTNSILSLHDHTQCELNACGATVGG
jgi:hypothetical protein